MERVSHERPVPRAACALEPLPEPEQPTVKAGRGGKTAGGDGGGAWAGFPLEVEPPLF